MNPYSFVHLCILCGLTSPGPGRDARTRRNAGSAAAPLQRRPRAHAELHTVRSDGGPPLHFNYTILYYTILYYTEVILS